MNPRVVRVVAAEDFTLVLAFTNGETRRFDVKPYLAHGVFRELANPILFATVRPTLGTIVWKNGQDLCPDTLYEESTPLRASRVLHRSAPVARARTRPRRGRPKPRRGPH